MSIVEFHGGPITMRYLENKSKRELARMYMDLLAIHNSQLDMLENIALAEDCHQLQCADEELARGIRSYRSAAHSDSKPVSDDGFRHSPDNI